MHMAMILPTNVAANKTSYKYKPSPTNLKIWIELKWNISAERSATFYSTVFRPHASECNEQAIRKRVAVVVAILISLHVHSLIAKWWILLRRMQVKKLALTIQGSPCMPYNAMDSTTTQTEEPRQTNTQWDFSNQMVAYWHVLTRTAHNTYWNIKLLIYWFCSIVSMRFRVWGTYHMGSDNSKASPPKSVVKYW